MWHNKNLIELYKELNTSERGLTSTEANIRLEKNGRNELPKKESKSIIKMGDDSLPFFLNNDK